VDLLSAREGRDAVRTALVAYGEDALQAVWWALRDTTRPRRLRIHLPKTLGRFGTKAAAEHLLENIESEEDGLVRYKSIRALELLVAERRISLERDRVERLARDALLRHFRLLESRVALGVPPLAPGRALPVERLLSGLLDDKLRQSLERAFRLLSIAHPREDFRRLRLACMSDDAYTRANAGELLDSLFHHRDQQPLRALIRLITDDLSSSERASRAAPLLARVVPSGRGEALAILARDRDSILARLASACAERSPALPADAPAALDVVHA
jgi:HEAT repeat protein